MKPKQKSSPLGALNAFDGVLLVDKPAGPTSHDLVDEIRRRFRIKKVGHGGTLDPMATGLLIILLGRGTKLSNSIMSADKIYEGLMHLGVTTDTEDREGTVLTQTDCGGVKREIVEDEMAKRVGDVMQTPPMVSAVKRNGVPLYQLARKGKIVEREPRLIHIYEFKLLDFSLPWVRFRLRCTKGTYVRTLCADIGRALHCGAYLEQLRRTQSGAMKVENAIGFEIILGLDPEQLAKYVIPIHRFLIDKKNE
jgi:tRNA pseudouridine55 synthase